MPDREHQWETSRLGHGNLMCSVCFVTDLEAQAIQLFECPGPPEDKMENAEPEDARS